ncbi:3-isopropylmalate dehydratase small subunit [Limnoraphis robusta Tam1]|uniref:3-isopropylmalate dehydratase small subunit n=1 Tax=Limnoraphis robusta CCNP1315 TaxID=3110306 RepID=A0ABU5TZL3_9CYAN|nr:3-isopropylmalate dehydratase small subunit [Limnoraphis robusta]MEA5499599.1 3-isopropylmalate dehydratase small subunit [Limnoraphis robusta BA-68 BA1]MEA5520376.1 3-isopropylmalate dehydratase small subunit [Limnoraphis robusta CCNP1315]MEA5542514.1 3-isopropylmalate dehydratase small subunit [Limnoraphis robusta Tam1]MEA5548219.1 3-isopropylmalate dehydratase small subunit [Limnoraphis robusta CCNP1324]
MSQIQSISGRGIPLVGSDIDTDRIIPARFLRCVTFDGLGEQVFADDRQQTQGNHPFDLPQYQGANILVVNGNFGCGSSREHAPQALAKWGIQAIIGESFAEIFFGNCVAIGVPCVIATPEQVQQLQQALQTDPQQPMSVNLEEQRVQCGDLTLEVNMNAGAQQMFLSGTWDSCGQLLANVKQIQTTASQLPYIHWANAAVS